MPASVTIRRSRLSLAFAVASLGFGSHAQATDYTWTGGGGNQNWTTGGNWNSSIPASNLTTTRLFFGGNIARNTPMVNSNYSVNSITFTAGGSTNYNIMSSGGSVLTIGSGGITNDSSGIQGFSAPIALGADQTWTLNSGPMSINALQTSTFDLTVAATAGRTLFVGGPITGSGTLTFSGQGATQVSGSSSYTGDFLFQRGSLSITSDASLTTISSLQITDAGSADTTTATLSGVIGSTTSTTFTLGSAANNSASANLTGATTALNSTTSTIGTSGVAAFTQSGGTHTTTTLLIANGVGSTASYDLTGGSLSSTTTSLGQISNGSFNQTGGTHFTGSLFIGGGASAVGTYSFSGGTLSAATQTVIGNLGTGTVTQSAGNFFNNTLTLASGIGSNGTYNLSGGAASFSTGNFGQSGTAAVNQTGGTLTTTGDLRLANLASSVGTYNLIAGSLSAANLYVGNTGTGTFAQSGGSAAADHTYIANTPSSVGVYTLAAGTLTTPDLQVGIFGKGTFTQTGGTVLATSVVLASQNTSIGTYALKGGTLQTVSVSKGTGTANFLVDGGTLRAPANTAQLSLGLPAQIGLGGIRIDSNGNSNLIFSGSLTSAAGAGNADGGLTKVGAGVLQIASAQSYTGATTVQQGTLAIASDVALGSNPVVNIQPGARLEFRGSGTTSKTYNLSSGTLAVAAGQSLTYTNATINGGAFSSTGAHRLGNGTSVNFVIAPATSNVSVANSATVNSSFFEVRGNLGIFSNGTLNAEDLYQTSAGTITLNGTLNASGSQFDGVVNLTIGATLNALSRGLTFGPGSRIGLSPGATLAATPGDPINLNAGLLVNNGTQTGGLNINYGSTVKGIGTFGIVTVADGGTFSPGNSPGTSTVTDLTLAAGGSYDFEISDVAADLINITHSLTISAGATANSQFTINLITLSPTNTPAALSTFDGNYPQTYTLLTTANPITGFNADVFNLNTSAFLSAHPGDFSLALSSDSRSLLVTYSPVPEPAALAPMLLGVAFLTRRRR